ncbi:hypothetical protein [Dapis sp. BLCC M172]
MGLEKVPIFQLFMHGSRKIKKLAFMAHRWAKKITPLLPRSSTR